MIRVILYILFFAYAINLVKPVMPYVSDTIAHIFWYSKHISTVHFENGKYHVHVESMAAAKKTGGQSPSDVARSAKALSEHISVHHAYYFELTASRAPVYPSFTFPISLLSRYADYPPPRVIV